MDIAAGSGDAVSRLYLFVSTRIPDSRRTNYTPAPAGMRGGIMCWSGEASTVLAGIGISATVIAARRGQDFRLWVPLGYFSLMEALQAFTYTVIDDCTSPANQVATLLGWIHVAFQPLLANLISLYFIPAHVRAAIEGWVFALVSVAVVILLLGMYPFPWAETCRANVHVFCGERLCSVSGDWHIAWELQRTDLLYGGIAYIVAVFVLPVLYGSWRMTLYHLVTGPYLAFVTTRDPNEFAAVWCLYSIGLLLVVAKTPVRRCLFVTRWPGYDWLARRCNRTVSSRTRVPRLDSPAG